MTEYDDPAQPLRQPRNVAVDLGSLVEAFENNAWELAYFLDLETGAVILLTEATRRQHEQLTDALGEVDRTQWAKAFETALAALDVPDWECDMIRDAERVAVGFGERYLGVPQAELHEGVADMHGFIATVANVPLRDRLSHAIQGRGAFRRFKDVLLGAPAERERWFAFREASLRERAREWLRSEGIEVV